MTHPPYPDPQAHERSWLPGAAPALFAPQDIASALSSVREGMHVVQDRHSGHIGVAIAGRIEEGAPPQGSYRLLATLGPTFPEWLGDRAFTRAHRLRYPYVAGAMANGIATPELVIAMARGGMLGFFGAAGLDPAQVAEGLGSIRAALGNGLSWGSNLIHAPNEPEIEWAVADLYIREAVTRVSASAYMKLTAPIVRYALSGLQVNAAGAIERRHHVFAKVSRPEVAAHFMRPAPEAMVRDLVNAGHLTVDEARLAALVPVAEDIIVESDSGGHTDNQALTALFPTLARLRDEIGMQHRYPQPVRLGAAGGLGTPTSVAAAFAMGAAFVLTGSINQASLESGLHPTGKRLLCQAGIADVTMAPAADMFELGVEVQVLSRGTMFAGRAKRLYEVYKRHDSLEAIPASERGRLESEILQDSLEAAWGRTRAYWAQRDPREVTRAEADPKHKMALTFRSYLGQSSKWAIAGADGRAMDHQIWCGPAMGAFNQWAKGSFLEPPQARSAVQIARNLLEGAAVISRAGQLRGLGVPIPPSAFDFRPRPMA